MEEEIEELTLLLLYLTSWEEDTLPFLPRKVDREQYMPETIYRSWKGYPFEIIDKLEEEGFIIQGRRSKSVCLTEEGIKRAEELKNKYRIG